MKLSRNFGVPYEIDQAHMREIYKNKIITEINKIIYAPNDIYNLIIIFIVGNRCKKYKLDTTWNGYFNLKDHHDNNHTHAPIDYCCDCLKIINKYLISSTRDISLNMLKKGDFVGLPFYIHCAPVIFDGYSLITTKCSKNIKYDYHDDDGHEYDYNEDIFIPDKKFTEFALSYWDNLDESIYLQIDLKDYLPEIIKNTKSYKYVESTCRGCITCIGCLYCTVLINWCVIKYPATPKYPIIVFSKCYRYTSKSLKQNILDNHGICTRDAGWIYDESMYKYLEAKTNINREYYVEVRSHPSTLTDRTF